MRFLVAGVAVIVYYKVAVGRLGPLSQSLSWKRLARRYPLRDMGAVLNLPVAALGQALFAIFLLWVTELEVWPLLTDGFHPVLLLYGAVLGVGEMALATLLCSVAIEATSLRRGGPASSRGRSWDVIPAGGWMRYHLKTVQLLPLPLAALSVLLYVAVEELVFRGILLQYLSPTSAAGGFAGSVALFVTVQTFHMPDWRSAMLPAVGALVIGILHTALALTVPSVLPLMVAHLVFFLSAVV